MRSNVLKVFTGAFAMSFIAGGAAAMQPLAKDLGLQLVATDQTLIPALDLSSASSPITASEAICGAINQSGQIVFRAGGDAEGEFAIVRAEPTSDLGDHPTLTLIASTDPTLMASQVPDHSGYVFDGLTCTPSINDAGDVAFSAHAINGSSLTAEVICLYHDGTLYTIVFSGDQAPSTDSGFTTPVYFTDGIFEGCPANVGDSPTHTKVGLTASGEIFFHASTTAAFRTWMPGINHTTCEPESDTSDTVDGDGLYVYRDGVIYALAVRYEDAPGYTNEQFLEHIFDNDFSVASPSNSALTGKLSFIKGLPLTIPPVGHIGTHDIWYGASFPPEVVEPGSGCNGRTGLDISPYLIEPRFATTVKQPTVIWGFSGPPAQLYASINSGSGWATSSLIPSMFSIADINYGWSSSSMLARPYARGIDTDYTVADSEFQIVFPLELEHPMTSDENRVSWILANGAGGETLFASRVSNSDFPTLDIRYNPSCACGGALDSLTATEFGGGWTMRFDGPSGSYRGTIVDSVPRIANSGQLAMLIPLYHESLPTQQALATRSIRGHDKRSYVDLISGPESVYMTPGLHGRQFFVPLPDGSGGYNSTLVEIVGMHYGAKFLEKSHMPDGAGAGLSLINDCGYIPIEMTIHEMPTSTTMGATHIALFKYKLRPRGDFNGDKALDLFDYLDFVDAFSHNQACADWNQDGVIDFFDYLDFEEDLALGLELGC